LLERTQAAIGRAGVDDEAVAAAMFLPRGHFGGAFAGGLVGDSVAGVPRRRRDRRTALLAVRPAASRTRTSPMSSPGTGRRAPSGTKPAAA
jgi:hypothetical protein